MTYVCTNMARICKSYLCVHICTVHIYQSAVLVDNVADFPNLNLKHTVGRRVSDHKSCKVLCICSCFLPKFLNVYVTVLIATYKYNAETCHSCRCRVGTVSRCRDDHYISVGTAICHMVAFDGLKACVLTCCT